MECLLELLEMVYIDELKGGVTPLIKNKGNLATFSLAIGKL